MGGVGTITTHWLDPRMGNYLIDWNSDYNIGEKFKRERTCSDDEDLLLLRWISLMNNRASPKL